jgi:hypothetical protein
MEFGQLSEIVSQATRNSLRGSSRFSDRGIILDGNDGRKVSFFAE